MNVSCMFARSSSSYLHCSSLTDIWEPKKNLENARDLVEVFEEEYGEGVRRAKRKDQKEF